MKHIRIFLACLVCRTARTLLHLTGRGGTSLPGKLALRVCPDILPVVARGVQSILVTGTNGKTTTVKLLCHALEAEGETLFTNRSGANLAAGITAEYILNANLFGLARCDWAVIECDEAALKLVSAAIEPKMILVTNLFRDQLDRYGDVKHTLAEIREGVKRSGGALLCLNADCSLTASLERDTENAAVFFGLDVASGEKPNLHDAPRCIYCGAAYDYSYHTFAHLGGFRCPDCGYSRPVPDLSVTEWEAVGTEKSRALFECDTGSYSVTLPLPSVYNVCNAAAVICAINALGFDVSTAVSALENAEAGFGRMETMTVGGTDVRMILVKNGAGCDRALAYLHSVPAPYTAVFCLNDRIADGTDISWLWDADFEGLLTENPPAAIAVYGSRAADLRLRLKYAGADEDAVRVLGSVTELKTMIEEADHGVYVLPNYSTMLEVRDALAVAGGKRRFWE